MKEIEDFIFSLKKEERSLRAIREFLRVLNNPHLNYKTIHIGGTNGKGSVTEMIYRILSEKYLVGKYISPHICRINERIVVNEKEIEDEYIVRFVSEFGKLSREIRAHFFDFLTAMAFKYFSDRDIEWAAVEVGLGGKYDSTNIINPQVSVITNVSYEHVDVLGTSIEEISLEKAGIIKNSPVVIGPTNLYSKKVFRNIAKNCIFADEWFRLIDIRFGENYLEIEVEGPIDGRFKINATGTYQIKNILTVLAVAKILVDFDIVSLNDIKKGLEKAKFPGRFEIFNRGNSKIILDSAHNPAAARELADTYTALYGCGGKAIVTQMKDKDHMNFFRELSRAVNEIVIPRYDYWRAQNQMILAHYAKKFFKNVSVVDEDAISYLQNLDYNGNIIVTGSIYLVGEVRKWLMKEEQY